MKTFVRIMNVLVALACILIIAAMLWFLYLTFVGGYSGGHAVTYILEKFLGCFTAL